MLGRGLFAKGVGEYGQFARGYSLSVVEPYLLDIGWRSVLTFSPAPEIANNFISYGTTTLGFSPRLGFALREDLSLQLRYSIFRQSIQLPQEYMNCNNISPDSSLGLYPTPDLESMIDPATGSAFATNCYADGEASLAVRKELAQGAVYTSAVGYS